MRSKLLSILLSVTLVLMLFPCSALVQSAGTGRPTNLFDEALPEVLAGEGDQQ